MSSATRVFLCRYMALRVLVILISVCLITPSVPGVVISGSDTGHDSAPVSDPGFDRVGRAGALTTGVYVGNGWVLTVNHGGSKNTFTVDGDMTYNLIPGTGQQLRNTLDTAYIDLYMFRVDTTGGGLDGLGDMPIISSIPAIGTQGTHIGTGETRSSPTETTWYVDTTPATWDWRLVDFLPERDTILYGYDWGGDASRDTLWAYQDIANNDYDFSDMEGFTTDFEQTADYGTVADNDSGSPFFINQSGTWYLAGTVNSIAVYNNQPGQTSIYGNEALLTDLSAYAGQINNIRATPEPGTLLLLAAGSFGLLLRRKRRK